MPGLIGKGLSGHMLRHWHGPKQPKDPLIIAGSVIYNLSTGPRDKLQHNMVLFPRYWLERGLVPDIL